MKKNMQLQTLVRSLKQLSIEQQVKLWKRLATDLEKPSRQRRTVNVYRISSCAKEGEIVVVPGKVLGEGDLDKKLTVAAYQFSDIAREKIAKKGKVLTIAELMKQNPKGQKVRIIG